jgi:hypothetical protein
MDEILTNEKIQCLQDEAVDCSSHCMKAFVWDFDGSQRVPYVPNGAPRQVCRYHVILVGSSGLVEAAT